MRTFLFRGSVRKSVCVFVRAWSRGAEMLRRKLCSLFRWFTLAQAVFAAVTLADKMSTNPRVQFIICIRSYCSLGRLRSAMEPPFFISTSELIFKVAFQRQCSYFLRGFTPHSQLISKRAFISPSLTGFRRWSKLWLSLKKAKAISYSLGSVLRMAS